MKTVLLLILSNTFMTVAWYGHLRDKRTPIVTTILVCWLIALPEYAFQVPANRLGHGQFSTTQLKIIQEIISISVFVVFTYFYFKESPTWRTGLAFGLIVVAVGLVVYDKPTPKPDGIPHHGNEAAPTSVPP